MQDREIIDLYNGGKTIRDISLIDGRSESSVYKILLNNKVKLRNKSEANKIVSDNVLIKLYNMALSFSQIGQLLDIDPSTVSKRFKSLGFDPRCRSVAKSIKYTDKEFNTFFLNKEFISKISLIKG